MSKCSEVKLFAASKKTVAGTKWGFINEKAEFVIKPQFDRANPFQKNGLAIVEINERVGVIDETGSYIVHPIYQFIEPFSEGLAVVGEIEGMMRAIDESGRVRTKAYLIIRSYRENRAVFWGREDMNGDNIGFLDHKGRVVIQPQYMNASDFTSGKALVKFEDKSYALIDLNGEILKTYPFQEVGRLSEGLFSFVRNEQGLTGYVNESGMIVISPAFSSGSSFYQDRAVVSVNNNNRQQSGLIDKAGAFIIPPEYDEIIMLGENRAAVGKVKDPGNVFKGAVYAIADTVSGHFFTDFIYDRVHDFQGEYSSVTKGLYSFFIKQNGVPAARLPLISGVGLLKLEGNVVIACIDGRTSYYDQHGNLIYGEENTIPH